jgi:hypothetical protein
MQQIKSIENDMYNLAKDFIIKRYPEGWGGVAVIHTDEGVRQPIFHNRRISIKKEKTWVPINPGFFSYFSFSMLEFTCLGIWIMALNKSPST